jgi:hypothetical protein
MTLTFNFFDKQFIIKDSLSYYYRSNSFFTLNPKNNQLIPVEIQSEIQDR